MSDQDGPQAVRRGWGRRAPPVLCSPGGTVLLSRVSWGVFPPSVSVPPGRLGSAVCEGAGQGWPADVAVLAMPAREWALQAGGLTVTGT